MVLNLMIFQKSHVAGVEPNDPGRHRAWQSDIEQAASARREPAVAGIAGFVPPTGLFPGVSRQRRRCREGVIAEKSSGTPSAMQIHGGFEHGFKFAFARTEEMTVALVPRPLDIPGSNGRERDVR